MELELESPAVPSESVLGSSFPGACARDQAFPGPGRSTRLATALPLPSAARNEMTDSPTSPAHGSDRPSTATRSSPQAVEVGLAVTRIFKAPLAALRASIESLARNLDSADPRRETLSGALAEVTRLARDVEALAAYAAPRPLMPLACSLEELLQGALARLAPQDAARVALARPASVPVLLVDGPLLTTALAHVLRAALWSSGDDVLLEARSESGLATFSVLSGGNGERLEALDSSRSHHDASLGLGLELARRDVLRMDGTFELDTSDASRVRVRIRLPHQVRPPAGRAA